MFNTSHRLLHRNKWFSERIYKAIGLGRQVQGTCGMSTKKSSSSSKDYEPETHAFGLEEKNELARLESRSLLEKEFPDDFHEGEFLKRISYVDFVDEALHRLKSSDQVRNLNAYKEIMRVFPPGKYHPSSHWDLGTHNAPQQLAGVRILNTMNMYRVPPDLEMEDIVTKAFSKKSKVWKKLARMAYWFSKMSRIDPYPVPDNLPVQVHQLAKLAVSRMVCDDPKTIVSVTNTSSVPDSIDKTWLVYSQSPAQKNIISELDNKSLLTIEEAGLTYLKDKYLAYFVLKVYDNERLQARRVKPIEKHYDYNRLRVQFYGKPYRQKVDEAWEKHYVGDGYILATAISGTSSQDSFLSLLKILQRRNPNLSELNVLFKFDRSKNEMLEMADSDKEGEPSSEQDDRSAPR